jgi:hypothetical protein
MIRLVYVAGPYTTGDPVVNTREACLAGAKLLDLGYAVIVPHTSLLWHAIAPRPYEVWLANDLEQVRRCDALVRLPGESSGADGEEAEAIRCGIPVFHSLYDLDAYFTRADELLARMEASDAPPFMVLRDAIVTFLRAHEEPATVDEISLGVGAPLPDVRTQLQRDKGSTFVFNATPMGERIRLSHWSLA